MGGMVWEGKPKYKSVDAALDDLEAALEKIIEEIGKNIPMTNFSSICPNIAAWTDVPRLD